MGEEFMTTDIREGREMISKRSTITLRRSGLGFAALVSAACMLHAQDGVEIEKKPLLIQGYVDFGQVMSGQSLEDGQKEVDGVPIQRTGIALTAEAIVNKRLNIQVGVGGLFWYSYPVSDLPHQRGTKFGPGISQARALYSFGDVEDPTASLEFGYFPYKYNRDALNLGEYLFRSGTYPGYLFTGGWSVLNSAAIMAQGLRLGVGSFGGMLQHDFLVTMEREYYPAFDFTPSYVATLRLGGALELGAGASLNHYLPLKPSQLTPKNATNGYVTGPKGTFALRDSRLVADPTLGAGGDTNYFTHKGVKLMGRVSFDLKAFLGGSDMFNPADLRIFAEAAVLGVKDYPIYYEKITERIPLMFGMNIPTFKFLDVLSIQGEIYKSRFPNSIENFYEYGLPVWTIDDNDPATFNDSAYTKDDFKWSVYAKRGIVHGVSLFGQVANDHFRTITFNPRHARIPMTSRSQDWYYLLRVDISI